MLPPAPVFFLKPPGSILFRGENAQPEHPVVELPRTLLKPDETHHEVELAIVLKRDLRRGSLNQRNSEEDATALVEEFVSHAGVAIDVTAREVQAAEKAKQLPWTVAKGIDTFLPMGPLLPVLTRDEEASTTNRERLISEHLPPVAETAFLGARDLSDLLLRLRVNGQVKQFGSTNLMIHDVPKLLRAASQFMSLAKGDVLLTGTPEGVAPLRDSDTVDIILGKPLKSDGEALGQTGDERVEHGGRAYRIIAESSATFAINEIDD